MGYQFWEGIPRSADDPTRIAAFVAAGLAAQDELSELNDVNIPAPADGEALIYNAATSKWIAGAGGDGDLGWIRYLKVNQYHHTPLWARLRPDGTTAYGADYLYAVPFPLPTQMTWDRIGINVGSGVAGNARLGIYDDDNSYPGALVLDAGIISVTSAGLKVISISQVLAAGLYWLVYISNVAPWIYRLAYYSHSIPGSTDGITGGGYCTKSQAYGALPDPFPGGGGLTSTTIPLIVMRRSA